MPIIARYVEVTARSPEPETEQCPTCDGPVYCETGYRRDFRETGVAKVPVAQYICEHCGDVFELPVH